MPSWLRSSVARASAALWSATGALSATSSARPAKSPDQITLQEVFAWAYAVGLSGKQPSSVAIGARLACLSSFYLFLIRMKLVAANLCDALERLRVVTGAPRGLSAEQLRKLLAVIPATPVGRRDKAIMVTLVLTGRRRAEVLNLEAGDIELGEPPMYRYRGKGGKTGRRELPRPAFEAIQAWLDVVSRDLATMAPTEPCGQPRTVGAASRAASPTATRDGT